MEILYPGSRKLLTRYMADLAAVLLPAGDALLSTDSRFCLAGATPDRMEKLKIPRYFKPHRLAASQIDFLYSEVVLLDLKLY